MLGSLCTVINEPIITAKLCMHVKVHISIAINFRTGPMSVESSVFLAINQRSGKKTWSQKKNIKFK